MREVALFIYGSLLSPAVLAGVIGRRPPFQIAGLSGYRRVRLRGESFPGLFAHTGAVTSGAVVWIRPRELTLLDAYEADFYRRQSVRVNCQSDGMTLTAHTYVLTPKARQRASTLDWDASRFHRRDAPGAAIRARQWRRIRTSS